MNKYNQISKYSIINKIPTHFFCPKFSPETHRKYININGKILIKMKWKQCQLETEYYTKKMCKKLKDILQNFVSRRNYSSEGTDFMLFEMIQTFSGTDQLLGYKERKCSSLCLLEE